MGIDLADDEEVVALAGNGCGERLLGAAVAVHLGGIDQRDAEIETELDRRDFRNSLRLALAHAPGAEPQHRHLVAALEGDMPHLSLQVTDSDCSRAVTIR